MSRVLSWVKVPLGFAVCAASFAGAAGAAPPDVKGSSDVPWIGRYADSHIVTFEQTAFDEVAVLTRRPKSPSRDDGDYLRLEGRRTLAVYQVPKGRSSLEVYRNFEQKLVGSGFAPVFTCTAEACGVNGAQLVTLAYGRDTNGAMSFSTGYFRAPRYGVFRKTDGGADQVAAIYVGESPSDGPRVALLAYEAKAMDTGRIVVPTADEMRQSLDANGRIALYGIYFDTGEATLKPESKPTLDQITALLKASPKLALVVAGHTDSTGDYAANLGLSERRATAVVAALVKAGVAPARLTAFGAGMAAPAARNDDEVGRAKNRRVELVKR